MGLRRFDPARFQGNLHRKNYFEGWYYKSVPAHAEWVFSCIPGISLASGDEHAFIQIIESVTGKTAYPRYDLEQFSWSRGSFAVRIGPNTWDREHMHLEIDRDGVSVHGELRFSEMITYPGTLTSPGIMGPYAHVPGMECSHGIVSVLHRLTGSLAYNSHELDFSGGTGYIEKDWGTSFPSSWVWLHANTGASEDFSCFFSYARIPWMGSSFFGFICFVYWRGEFYRFATYNRSTITHLEIADQHVSLVCENRSHVLTIEADAEKGGLLQAPVKGQMKRKITESLNALMQIDLVRKDGEQVLHISGAPAGFEVCAEQS